MYCRSCVLDAMILMDNTNRHVNILTSLSRLNSVTDDDLFEIRLCQTSTSDKTSVIVICNLSG